MVVEDALGPTTLRKSVRSLVNAFRSFEGEVGTMLGKVGEALPVRSGVRRALGAGRHAFAELFGVALSDELDALRTSIERVTAEVGQLREREVLLAGGVSQLRASSDRFADALAALARVQGRDLARIVDAAGASSRLETLATRRDEHITRLIRDLTAQRAGIDRISERLARLERVAEDRTAADALREALEELRQRLESFETGVRETRKLQQNSSQGTLQAMELTRERLGRLEHRMVEITREARVKSGRLDALSRHVTSVEGRLSSAIGQTRPVVNVGTSGVGAEGAGKTDPHPAGQ